MIRVKYEMADKLENISNVKVTNIPEEKFESDLPELMRLKVTDLLAEKLDCESSDIDLVEFTHLTA